MILFTILQRLRRWRRHSTWWWWPSAGTSRWCFSSSSSAGSSGRPWFDFMTRFENVENVCSDVVNFKLNARKESKKVVLSSEARAALRSQLSLTNSTLLYPVSTRWSSQKSKYQYRDHLVGQLRTPHSQSSLQENPLNFPTTNPNAMRLLLRFQPPDTLNPPDYLFKHQEPLWNCKILFNGPICR